MSIASLLSIKVTSPITHMVSSAVRGVAASMLGVWLFHDVISTYVFDQFFLSKPISLSTFFCSGRASSIATILIGSIFYTWVKHKESQKTYERVPLEKMMEEGKGDMSPTKRSRTPSD